MRLLAFRKCLEIILEKGENRLDKCFLWGGSIAAHQCEGAFNEGGKGLAIMDLVTNGNHETPREISQKIADAKF